MQIFVQPEDLYLLVKAKRWETCFCFFLFVFYKVHYIVISPGCYHDRLEKHKKKKKIIQKQNLNKVPPKNAEVLLKTDKKNSNFTTMSFIVSIVCMAIPAFIPPRAKPL